MYDRTEEYVLRSVPKGSEILDLNRTRGSGVFNLEILILVLFPKKKEGNAYTSPILRICVPLLIVLVP